MKEGKAVLDVEVCDKVSSDMPVFYNPRMKVNRDFSVAFARSVEDELTVLDCFSASGVMGLRYALECENIEKVIFNDKNREAFKAILKNIELNGGVFEKREELYACGKVGKACFEVYCRDIFNLLKEELYFNYADIDPFGSPSKFIFEVARKIYWKGYCAVTATDTSALYGTAPLACMRKYGFKSARLPFSRELGARILISFLITSFSTFDKAFIPLFTLYNQHFYRVFGRVTNSRKDIRRLLEEFGEVYACRRCGAFSTEPFECSLCGKRAVFVERLYLGPIFEKEIAKKVCSEVSYKFAEVIKGEAEKNVVFYYDMHAISSVLKTSPPSVEKVIEALKDLGYHACRTHFSTTSVKTNASIDEVIKVIREIK